MKKIKLLFLLVLIFIVVSISYGTSSVSASDDTIDMDSNMGGGSGTKSDPFLISNLSEFSYFVSVINSQLGNLNYTDSDGNISKYPVRYLYYELTADLDILEYVSENDFTGIGTEDYPFYGNFDGDNHTISGFDVSGEIDSYYLALFSYVRCYQYTAIENIIVDVNFNVVMTATTDGYSTVNTVGGIIGYINHVNYRNQITNCVSNGTIIADCDYCAGILAFCSADATNVLSYAAEYPIITNCTNNCNITLNYDEYAGGFVGGISGTGAFSIQNCVNNGDIISTGQNSWIAGISVGYVYTGAYCINNGNLECDYEGHSGANIAGLFLNCGMRESSYTGDYYYAVARGCINKGNISLGEDTTLRGDVGGICATCWYVDIINCVNYGSILEDGDNNKGYSGAIIAATIDEEENFNYKLTNCYSINESSQTSLAGDATITDGIVSFEDMQDENTFTGFDFSSIWSITDEYLVPSITLYQLTYVGTETLSDNLSFPSAIAITYYPGDRYISFSNSTFVGMYYDSDFTDSVAKTDLLSEDTTIYTEWDVTTYTVKLYVPSNTDIFDYSYITVTIDASTMVIEECSEYDMTQAGYTITGVSTEDNGEGTVYSIGDAVSFDYSNYEFQSLYLIIESTSTSSNTSTSASAVIKKVGSIVGIILLLMVLLLVACFLLFFYKRRKNDEESELNIENESNLYDTNKKSFKEEARETIKDMKKSFLNVLSKIKNWFKKKFSKKSKETRDK